MISPEELQFAILKEIARQAESNPYPDNLYANVSSLSSPTYCLVDGYLDVPALAEAILVRIKNTA